MVFASSPVGGAEVEKSSFVRSASVCVVCSIAPSILLRSELSLLSFSGSGWGFSSSFDICSIIAVFSLLKDSKKANYSLINPILFTENTRQSYQLTSLS